MTQREWLCLDWESSVADKVEGRNENIPEGEKTVNQMKDVDVV